MHKKYWESGEIETGRKKTGRKEKWELRTTDPWEIVRGENETGKKEGYLRKIRIKKYWERGNETGKKEGEKNEKWERLREG